MSATPEAAIYDILIELQGYYPNQVAEMLPDKLRSAGWALVSLPKNVEPAEVEWSWRYRSRADDPRA